MKKISAFLLSAVFGARSFLDPALEGSPYEPGYIEKRRRSTDKPSMPIFRRKFAWR